MATHTTTILVDDLDGGEAAETVRFGLDGRDYDIDLSDVNAKTIRDTLAPFVANARKVGGRPTRAQVNGGGRSSREETAAIRAWARQNGHELSDRGRIPKAVIEAYQASGATP
jgi:hypothetical protein